MSTSEEDIAVKFFPPEIKRSWLEIEVEALSRAKGNPLFQQSIGNKAPTDMTAGYIVTKFIQGKSFYFKAKDRNYPEEYQNNLENYIINMGNDIRNIPKEYWKQLVLIYEFAEKQGIIIDANPNNFKYDKNRGFIVLDYFPQDPRVMFGNNLKKMWYLFLRDLKSCHPEVINNQLLIILRMR